jgi:transposase
MAPPPSHSQSALPGRNSLVLDSILEEQSRFVLNVRTDQIPRCPECRRRSNSYHSKYIRTVQDLPWQGREVQLRLLLRRFRCRNVRCIRKVFAERVPDVVRRHGRRTERLHEIVRAVGYAAGGLPGSRLLHRLAIPVSDDSVLRAVSRRCPVASRETVRHLGVDDWAWKKGQDYGTILVDLDRHRVIDLLPGRSAAELSRWLQEQPGIEVIARDRCGIYAEGASAGAPDSIQVADRFHLVVNLSHAVERALEACSAQLTLSQTSPVVKTTGESLPDAKPLLTQHQIRSQQRRQRRLEQYENVIELHAVGYSQSAIAESLHIQRKTVRRWLRADGFPERKKPIRAPLRVEEHAEYLQKRWNAGCHNATTLFQELRCRGYKGGRTMVARYVGHWRKTGKAERRAASNKIAPKHAAILACKPDDKLSDEQRCLLSRLVTNCPTLALIRVLTQDFREALFGGDSSRMLDWIRNATQSGVGPLIRFGYGLRKDLAAVSAAVETSWSSGQVEGQINRLKAIKRQMYGRAGFNLLRSRVLPYVGAAPP